MLQTLKEWDRELFIFLNNLGFEQYDTFWIFVTQIESWAPLFIYFFILLIHFYGPRKGLLIIGFTLLTFIITITLTNTVKEYVARLRPNNVEALGELIRILQKPTNFSFWSGHSASSFAVTTFVALSLRYYSKLIYIAYIWPLLFVMSRIYVGVHYPSDILVGALVGTTIAFIMHLICKNLLPRLPQIEEAVTS